MEPVIHAALDLCEMFGLFKARLARSSSWSSSEGPEAVKGQEWGLGTAAFPAGSSKYLCCCRI